VGEVVPETRRTPVGDLEVRHLLTHSSGLPAWLPFYCLAEGRRERIAGILQHIEVERRPGTEVVYSCVGFIILGLMLENLAATDLAALFHSRVLSPLGLHDELGFRPDPDRRSLAGGAWKPTAEERLVRDLGLDPKWIPALGRGLPDDGNSRFFGGVAGNAGLFGTARGVSVLTAEFCRKTPLLVTPAEVDPAVTLQTAGLRGQERGWGWQLATTAGCSAGNGVPENGFGHTGFTGVSVWAEREQGRVWVLLANRNHPGQRGVDLHPIRRRFHALAVS
jgi:CubicO group peptidase (beta-lactamase class C family)